MALDGQGCLSRKKLGVEGNEALGTLLLWPVLLELAPRRGRSPHVTGLVGQLDFLRGLPGAIALKFYPLRQKAALWPKLTFLNADQLFFIQASSVAAPRC
jgi:hypothetical protein